jgi:Spy/CpxP family protein refolding chaperone
MRRPLTHGERKPTLLDWREVNPASFRKPHRVRKPRREEIIMYPGMFDWWRQARRASHAWGASAGCGPSGCGPAQGWDRQNASPPESEGDFGGGGPFGVRRPLRFLFHKLGLDEKQVAELARILNELKTERAQAAVDYRRSTAAFADAIAADTFDTAKAESIAGERVKSAERVRDALLAALAKIHALLTPEQRGKLAYLIRTGALVI